MSKSVQTVLISRRDGSDQAYHVDDDCYNLPDEYRELPKAQATCTYRACGRCCDDVEDTKTSVNGYECVECGNQTLIGSRGIRTLHACQDCGEVTTYEKQ